MKALQIATIFALLVFGAMSNNVQPTETLAQRIPSHGLKMLGKTLAQKMSQPSLHRPKPTVPNHATHAPSKTEGSKNNSPAIQKHAVEKKSQAVKPHSQKAPKHMKNPMPMGRKIYG